MGFVGGSRRSNSSSPNYAHNPLYNAGFLLWGGLAGSLSLTVSFLFRDGSAGGLSMSTDFCGGLGKSISFSPDCVEISSDNVDFSLWGYLDETSIKGVCFIEGPERSGLS